MNASKDFDVFHCPLEGIRLIEASAGTGKTWNICGLYLRLLLEQALDIQHILVVTFTNSATAELRTRIRNRIVELLAFLDSGLQGHDDFPAKLIAAIRDRAGPTPDVMMQRLRAALGTFDEAAIFTIHSYCQRALADAPFASGHPFTLELVEDDGDVRREAVHDFWRRYVATDHVSPALAGWLVAKKDTPAKWSALLGRWLAKPLSRIIWPAELAAARVLAPGTELSRTSVTARSHSPNASLPQAQAKGRSHSTSLELPDSPSTEPPDSPSAGLLHLPGEERSNSPSVRSR